MINSAHKYDVSEILSPDSNVRYAIPKYQRKYTWRKEDWEAIFDDVCFNPKGHFLGSIICINQTKDANAAQELDLVDGQQRMTTITLLYAAIYKWLMRQEADLDEDQLDDVKRIRRRVLFGKKELRVTPSYHGNNLVDYRWAMHRCGALADAEKPANVGNRRIMKAFRYFLERLNEIENGSPKFTIESALDLLTNLNAACVVKIEVSSHSDAYVLFESLNNRGVPLSAIDLIKNKLLSEMEKRGLATIDENFEQWNTLLNNLGDSYKIQERFLRQFYNAFRHDENITVGKAPKATRSNLIQIYETLIEKDPKSIFDKLRNCSDLYARLIVPDDDDNDPELTKQLEQLERIQGAPSYAFLMYVLSRKPSQQLLVDLVKLLVRFFVRRNVTDFPNTYALDSLFMDLIQVYHQESAESIAPFVRFVRAKSSDDDRFRSALHGDIYENNVGATRFLLCSLEEDQQTAETMTDLWKRDDKNKFIWTIEHIFPQGENVPDCWVQMIADGKKEKAKEYREKYVHRLGNLTLTGFNSKLGNMSFEKKRDRKDRNNKIVGYKNGLAINNDLKDRDDWSVDAINTRTDKMIDRLMTIFSFESIAAES
ncbi:DUF262 domain-containing HNH endonuclease family protein [Stieleria sp. ICT_E10.1]|uniref:DUF262 domain-containing protein n=1 Tax=Stieleria sedimenti TaxID=2976331 RepID=UPI00217FC750|nr:DUF262 domain-containing HNH endonuclease family protein [Stieleria sedimenti]MCS7466134.1 DUF262 domain-containing HNH endonuclease family protein [Stieleria sedimenti]